MELIGVHEKVHKLGWGQTSEISIFLYITSQSRSNQTQLKWLFVTSWGPLFGQGPSAGFCDCTKIFFLGCNRSLFAAHEVQYQLTAGFLTISSSIHGS